MRTRNTIIADCVALLQQGAQLIEQIDNAVFATPTPISPRGSIGGHLRHVLDFYSSFIKGIQKHQVDYSNRERNPLVEQQRHYALEKIQSTIKELLQLPYIDANLDLLVSSEGGMLWTRSSVMRELDFLKSHTIHHYSLIAMLMRLHEIEPGDEFGVAPSTLRYWRSEITCAQ